MAQSDYPRKLEAALTEMDNAGIRASNAVPPYLRVARRFGLELRPPYYISFAKVALSAGVYFAVMWGLLTSLIFWQGYEAVQRQLINSVESGLLFGVTLAAWYRYVRWKRSLSSWDDL